MVKKFPNRLGWTQKIFRVLKNFLAQIFAIFCYKNGHNSQNICTKDLGLGSKFTSSHILQWPSRLELIQKAFWVLIFMYAQIRRKKIKAKIFFNTLKKFWVHPNLLGIFLARRAMPRGKFRAQSEVSSVKIDRVMPVLVWGVHLTPPQYLSLIHISEPTRPY